MAILKVARLGHPVLRQPAEPVSAADIHSAPVQQLIDDMIETMHEYDGAGLAANQVHVPRQIAVIEVAKNERYPEAPEIPLTVVINPVVTPLSEETEDGWEGCLSVPDMRGVVPRYTAVRLECLDREGNPVELVAKDFFARSADEIDATLAAGARLVLLDLTGSFDYAAIFAALERATPRPPVLAYTTHALARQTQPWHARCGRVVTKETLTQELPGLLREGIAPPGGPSN